MAAFGTDRRVLVLAFARMADGIGNSFLIVVLPLYVASGLVTGRTFGLTESMVIGIVLSAFGLLNSSFQPLTGRLADRTARRKVYILVGLGVLAVTNLLYVLAPTYASLLAIRIVQGIGVAFIVPASIALVNELASADTRGGNMGVYNTFRLVGFGAGPVVAGAVVNVGPYDVAGYAVTGFEAAFLVAAAAAATSFALVTALVHDPPDLVPASGDLSIAVLDDAPDRVFDPVFTLGIANLCMAGGIALFATLQPQVNARLGQGATWFGVQFSAFIAAQVLLQAPLGRASDHYGRRPFLLAGFVLLAPSTLVQGLVTTSWAMLLARFVQGVAGAMVFAPSLALAGDLANAGESGSTLSVLTMAFGYGVALGPLAAGFLVAFGFVVPFAFGATLALLALALVYTQVEETAPATVESGAGDD